MDATVVQAFATLDDGGKQPAAADATGSLRNLTLVVSSEAVKPKLREAGTPDPARKTQAQTDLLASGRETV
jgi:hypothetical protein